MARPFDFSQTVQRAARLRQWGLCGHCGDSLDHRLEHAHHVIPNQSGTIENPAAAFLRSAENCAILCDACHAAAHAHGAYKSGAVAPADWFPYSHGQQGQAEHLRWRLRIDSEWRRLFRH
jgi:hypothetical protein